MWLILKIKNKCNILNLKKNLYKLLKSEAKLYSPKIQIHKRKANKFYDKDYYILGNYIIVFHARFKDNIILNKINFLKDVQYLLDGFKYYQNDINHFVNKCKTNEDAKGYLIQNFFNLEKGQKVKFSSGPFANFISELIDIQKKRICVLAGKYKILVNKNQNCILSG